MLQKNLLCVVATCFSAFLPSAVVRPANPVIPALPANKPSAATAATLLYIPVNRSFLSLIAFLQIGFATSHHRMLKVKVSFKSRPVFAAGTVLRIPCRGAAPVRRSLQRPSPPVRETNMKIGELSRRAGLHASAIRYYE